MRKLPFALGFILGVLARPVRLVVTAYYPRTMYGQTLDERRRVRIFWSTEERARR